MLLPIHITSIHLIYDLIKQLASDRILKISFQRRGWQGKNATDIKFCGQMCNDRKSHNHRSE